MPLHNEEFVIGIDGGASKTSAVVLDKFGTVLGRGQSGSANYHHLGVDGVGEHLHEAMAQAAAVAGRNLQQVTAVTWALAGVDRPVDSKLLSAAARRILPGIPVHIYNDATAALVAGLSQIRPGQPPIVSHRGVALIAGTGMIAFGENHEGKRARAGGWGYILEKGSAYHLSIEMLRTVIRVADGVGLPTPLLRHVLAYLNLDDVNDVVTWLYDLERQVADVAALAPVVMDEAETGDVTAVSVLQKGAAALAESVFAVSKKLGLYGKPYRMVMAGSLLTKSEFYRDLVIQTVLTRQPQVQPVAPQYDAAIGAGLMALESLGWAERHPPDEVIPKNMLWSSEQRNLLTHQFDQMSSLMLAGTMHLQDRVAVDSLWPVLPEIADTVDALAARMKAGGRLIYVGAGTSGRLGILDASECPPTFNSLPEQVVGVIAGGETAVTRSVEGAEDNPEAGEQAMVDLDICKNDSVVGIAASGRTPYVIGALREAKQRGALTIAVVNNLPAPVAETAVHVLAPLVGPEVVTGSTRLKAGTAQKLVLNMLSTGVMVRLGKTYGNLMVDVQQSNSKLIARAKRIVAQACNISENEAAHALEACQGDVKIAIVSTLTSCTPDEAQQRLLDADEVVRKALS